MASGTIYTSDDPRANILKEMAHRVFNVLGTNPLLAKLHAAAQVVYASPWRLQDASSPREGRRPPVRVRSQY